MGNMRFVACLTLFSCLGLAQSPSPDALFNQAVEAQQRGDFNTAINAYEQFLKTHPKSIDALANLGAALAQTGRLDEAIERYRAALKLEPGNVPIHMNLGLAFYKKPDLPDAAHEFELAHHAQPQDVRTSILLGDTLERLGRHGEVIQLLAPIEQAQTGNPDLEYVLGSALIHQGSRREGAEMMERVAKSTNGADGYLIAGSARVDLNDLEQAAQDLDSASRLNPSLPAVHSLLGTVRDKLGDQAGAEPELRKALELNPNDFQANLTLGAILFKQKRDVPEARGLVEHALKLDPSSTLARYELALIKTSSNELQSAAGDLEQVVGRDPQWLDPHIRLAALYFRLNRGTDGQKEREIVDRLTAEQQQRETSSPK